jgi:hypothetical protein
MAIKKLNPRPQDSWNNYEHGERDDIIMRCARAICGSNKPDKDNVLLFNYEKPKDMKDVLDKIKKKFKDNNVPEERVGIDTYHFKKTSDDIKSSKTLEKDLELTKKLMTAGPEDVPKEVKRTMWEEIILKSFQHNMGLTHS